MSTKTRRLVLYLFSALLIVLGVNSVDKAFVEDTLDITSEHLSSNETGMPHFDVIRQGKVVSVLDGDTATVLIDGKVETVRVIGIDTPETVRPDYPVECFGEEASKRAFVLLSNQVVSIITDSTQDQYDKYDRLLAYVELNDGRDFGDIMIREGLAYEFTFIEPYQKQPMYREAENYAKRNEIGLWADGACEGW